jgi:antitoxin PrlF
VATRLTSKGQVTIPKSIRERLGVKPGDEVEFVADEFGPVIVRSADAARRFAETLARLRLDPPIKGYSTDEILDMTRGSDR